MMNSQSNHGFFRRILGYIGAPVGGTLVFLCTYWFLHFETWHERGIYIGLTLLAAWIVAKCVPVKYR
jgi:uncharacterized membrane protein YeaQ/YmgE (transglycosylase-associated protein family)